MPVTQTDASGRCVTCSRIVHAPHAHFCPPAYECKFADDKKAEWQVVRAEDEETAAEEFVQLRYTETYEHPDEMPSPVIVLARGVDGQKYRCYRVRVYADVSYTASRIEFPSMIGLESSLIDEPTDEPEAEEEESERPE